MLANVIILLVSFDFMHNSLKLLITTFEMAVGKENLLLTFIVLFVFCFVFEN